LAGGKKKAAFGDELLEANPKARFDYEILEEFEAGIVLLGSEVKSVRDRKLSLKEAYCQFRGTELWLLQAHVAAYPQAHGRNHEPLRPRKLLLNRRELDRLATAASRDGLAIVPLAAYVQGRRVKLRIGLGRGRKRHDKRQAIRAREQGQEIRRAVREGDD
jgi:SsrA-binding protein